ncbi:MAG: sulfatase [Planctomycetota bacterium]|nr:sulfatase [Planctomycetota bacterium]
MQKARTCSTILAGMLWICLANSTALGEEPPAAPVADDGTTTDQDWNVVLVSFDALQAAHVGCYGYPRNVTPFMDGVARQGFLFREAISVASWTVPASMTWFTGVYPSQHRMTNKYAVYNEKEKKLANLKELSPGLITLADVMKQNGYRTGGFTGNAGVSGGFGYEQGFDTYYYPRQKFGSIEESIPRAIRWLEANRKKKFFLFLHGYDVHGQRTPDTGYDYRFVDPDYDRKYTGTELEQELLREEGLEKGQLTLRDEDVRFWRAIYDEKIQRMDKQFGQFLAALDRLGLTGKTLLLLTSDHGTEFYEHRRFDHGFTLYNELIHVPLVIKLPGQTSGKVITDRISSIDVMPTILDLLNVKVPAEVQKQLRGTSLAATMTGEPARRNIFSETDYRDYTFKRSIITPDGWKLIYTLEEKSRELYHLQNDPGELMNLADAQPDRADQLQRMLFSHFKSLGQDLEGKTWKRGLKPVYRSQARNPSKN